MVGSHLSHLGLKFDPTWDPTFDAGILHPTRILDGISTSHLGVLMGLMHSTWDPTRDLHIPPKIIYPNYKNIVLQFLFLQKFL